LGVGGVDFELFKMNFICYKNLHKLGPWWEKQHIPQYGVGKPAWYKWDFHLPNINTMLYTQPQQCESTQNTHNPFLSMTPTPRLSNGKLGMKYQKFIDIGY
jgi:hypothetical protein